MTGIFRVRAILAAMVLVLSPLAAHAADITVFAAASLTDALGEIGKSWQVQSGHTVAFSFAASSVLARQLDASGGADMFLSADGDWMNDVDSHNLIQRDTRKDLLGNRLVLIEPAGRAVSLRIAPHFDLLGALGGGRLAIASPDSVPAGKYGKAALINLGVWDSVADHLAPGENVRVTLAYVARGDTPFGIVYTTDALSEPRVRIVGTFPDASHPPIVYPVALMKDARPLARDFLRYLESPHARGVFLKDGFIVPGRN
ncbi:MAG: molybdate ABC transporter substrate-binding protein [Rhizomicrobium sp.]|jgi:molybdate transport system substrate-binding protein